MTKDKTYLTALQKMLIMIEDEDTMSELHRRLIMKQKFSYSTIINIVRTVLEPCGFVEIDERSSRTKIMTLTDKGKLARDLMTKYNKLLEV